MFSTKRWCRSLCLPVVGLSIAVIGCGPTAPVRQEVSGTVTWDGEPLSLTSVVFRPQNSDGVGSTSELTSGQFRLTEEQGLTPGLYDVVLLPIQPDLEDYEALRQQGKMPLTGPEIPQRYQRRGALTAEVKVDQPNHFEFEISSR